MLISEQAKWGLGQAGGQCCLKVITVTLWLLPRLAISSAFSIGSKYQYLYVRLYVF